MRDERRRVRETRDDVLDERRGETRYQRRCMLACWKRKMVSWRRKDERREMRLERRWAAEERRDALAMQAKVLQRRQEAQRVGGVDVTGYTADGTGMVSALAPLMRCSG